MLLYDTIPEAMDEAEIRARRHMEVYCLIQYSDKIAVRPRRYLKRHTPVMETVTREGRHAKIKKASKG